jgi:hypothetical protein
MRDGYHLCPQFCRCCQIRLKDPARRVLTGNTYNVHVDERCVCSKKCDCHKTQPQVLSECSEMVSCLLWEQVAEVRFLPLGQGSEGSNPLPPDNSRGREKKMKFPPDWYIRRSLKDRELADIPEVLRLMRLSCWNGFTFGALARQVTVAHGEARDAIMRMTDGSLAEMD